MVYEFEPCLIMWIVDSCATAGSVVVMVVAAITNAVITAITYILVIVIQISVSIIHLSVRSENSELI